MHGGTCRGVAGCHSTQPWHSDCCSSRPAPQLSALGAAKRSVHLRLHTDICAHHQALAGVMRCRLDEMLDLHSILLQLSLHLTPSNAACAHCRDMAAIHIAGHHCSRTSLLMLAGCIADKAAHHACPVCNLIAACNTSSCTASCICGTATSACWARCRPMCGSWPSSTGRSPRSALSPQVLLALISCLDQLP